MQTPIEIFEVIAKDIPRCSKAADKMAAFVEEFAKNLGFSVQTDSFKNILCQKSSPKICLQSHYDMVCVGDTTHIKTIIKDGWMSAENSSLGADNGMGVAMMLSLMQHFDNVEFLFTSDEEIGLIGAKNCELKISSDKVLNLDSEEEGAIYVACAGGIDITASKNFEMQEADGDFYELTLDGFCGGHSGVDIDKNIPNAIIELAKILKSCNAQIASFVGGEKRNSIPVSAKAIAKIDNFQKPKSLSALKCSPQKTLKNSSEFLDTVVSSPNGVWDFNVELGVPQTSSNLGIISLVDGKCEITYSVRSMASADMQAAEAELISYLQKHGFSAQKNDFYEPWEWTADEFCIFTKSVFKKYFINSNFKAIHAGLECAALKKHFPHASFASVGPNIKNPHSIHERVEIESVNKSYEAIFELIRQTL